MGKATNVISLNTKMTKTQLIKKLNDLNASYVVTKNQVKARESRIAELIETRRDLEREKLAQKATIIEYAQDFKILKVVLGGFMLATAVLLLALLTLIFAGG